MSPIHAAIKVLLVVYNKSSFVFWGVDGDILSEIVAFEWSTMTSRFVLSY